MVALTVLILTLMICRSCSVAEELQTYSQFVQSLCATWAPTPYTEIHRALVCGLNELPARTRSLWVASGLIHLLIVSGSHLIFIWSALSTVKLPWVFKTLLIAAFTFVSGLQPPCVRAWIALLIAPWQRTLGWSNVGLQFRASLICCVLFPHWWNSWSLQLSTLASLTLGYVTFQKNPLRTQVYVSVLLAPLLGGGTLWPSIWLGNLFMGPILGGLLFPLSVLSFVVGGKMFSHLMDVIFVALRALASIVEISPVTQPGTLGTIYVIFVYLWLEFRPTSKESP